MDLLRRLARPPAACVLAVLGLAAAAGEISFAGDEGAFAGAVVAAIPWLFVKNSVQEVGWRGRLTPRLRALGLGDLVNHARRRLSDLAHPVLPRHPRRRQATTTTRARSWPGSS